jgi:hypothetical protein
MAHARPDFRLVDWFPDDSQNFRDEVDYPSTGSFDAMESFTWQRSSFCNQQNSPALSNRLQEGEIK